MRRRALASRPPVFNFPSRPLTQVQVSVHYKTLTRKVLVDSGADVDLLDWGMVKRLSIKTEILPRPITARALDGKILFNVTHVTEPITLTFADKHTEDIRFHLFNSALYPLILGFPWLTRHNPHIDWGSGRIKEWGFDCRELCFRDNTGDRKSVV